MMRVSEIFYSIQGEGLLAGLPSVFVRFAGCPLFCRWCDTPQSRRPVQGRKMTAAEILAAVDTAGGAVCRHVVMTGGEPLLWKTLPELSIRLGATGRHVTIETAAIRPPPDRLHCDLASLSPKLSNSNPESGVPKARRMLHEARRLAPAAIDLWMARFACQLKFVFRSKDDIHEILDLLKRLSRPPSPDRVLLMPEGQNPEAMARHAAAALQAALQYGFRYCDRLQVRLFERSEKAGD